MSDCPHSASKSGVEDIITFMHKFMQTGKKKRREFGKSDEADGTEYQREDGDTERNSNDELPEKRWKLIV